MMSEKNLPKKIFHRAKSFLNKGLDKSISILYYSNIAILDGGMSWIMKKRVNC